MDETTTIKKMMTWEETIKFIRTQPEYEDLVKFAYFDKDLKLNVERFKDDEEFIETKKIIKEVAPFHSSVKLLDIGSGNGISAVSFALEGLQVDAVEPDPSDTIGSGAIKKLKEIYQLSNLNVHQAFAEELKFPDQQFDIVYARQCMHHAYDLTRFIQECHRVLKKGGLLITVRDHVIYDEADKALFLEGHPLQKFYGGENAFTEAVYAQAMKDAGFAIEKVLKHFDSVINYFPLAKNEKEKNENKNNHFIKEIIQRKLGVFARMEWMKKMAYTYIKSKLGEMYDEKKIPWRMYTFLAVKK